MERKLYKAMSAFAVSLFCYFSQCSARMRHLARCLCVLMSGRYNETSGTKRRFVHVHINGASAVAAVSVVVRSCVWVRWWVGMVRLCDPCARMRPCVPRVCPVCVPAPPVSFDIYTQCLRVTIERDMHAMHSLRGDVS